MTMNEKKMQSIEKEIAKYSAQLERYEKALEKKTALCEKLGCLWSEDEFRARRKAMAARHVGQAIVPFGDDDDLITAKQNAAYFDYDMAIYHVNEAKENLENAEKRYAKISGIVEEENAKDEAFRAAYERASEIERKWLAEKAEQEYLAWVKEFVAECAKDGIKVDANEVFMPSNNGVHGETPNGKRFVWYINNGWTERSYHCYTLRIDGKTIFTSGTFWRCYQIVKHN